MIPLPGQQGGHYRRFPQGAARQQLGLTAFPASSSGQQSELIQLGFVQYSLDFGGRDHFAADIALICPGNGKSFVIVLITTPAEAAALHKSVFVAGCRGGKGKPLAANVTPAYGQRHRYHHP